MINVLDSLSRSMSRTGFMSPFNNSKTSATSPPATTISPPTAISPGVMAPNPSVAMEPSRTPDPGHNVHSSTGSSLSRSSLGSHGKTFTIQVLVVLKYMLLLSLCYVASH